MDHPDDWPVGTKPTKFTKRYTPPTEREVPLFGMKWATLADERRMDANYPTRVDYAPLYDDALSRIDQLKGQVAEERRSKMMMFACCIILGIIIVAQAMFNG